MGFLLHLLMLNALWGREALIGFLFVASMRWQSSSMRNPVYHEEYLWEALMPCLTSLVRGELMLQQL
ncbi:hypothetical protein LINPERHAP1_LOCUS7702, partial [Linum perenne]